MNILTKVWRYPPLFVDTVKAPDSAIIADFIMSVSRSAKASSKAVVTSTCAASQSVSEAAHHTSAAVKTWMSEEKNSYVIQMKTKLKSHPDFKDSGENELLSAAKKLIFEEELYCDFSHLIQGEPLLVFDELAEFRKKKEYVSKEEREAAKDREQKRFDRLAKLKLTVCLRDIGKGDASVHKDRTVISIANFLSMEYSGKHAAILVDDVLLEWNNGNVIIPRRVTKNDTFMFEGHVHETIADHRPQLHEEPKTPEDEGDILCYTLALKMELIKKIIAVVVEYNSLYYYNMVARNCQHFVQAVLEAAKIGGTKFSTENEEYLKLFRKGKMRVPQSFKNHEDIDNFILKSEEKSGLKSLNEHELNWLVKAYKTHHGERDCAEATCQFDAVIANLVSRETSN